MEQRAQTQDKNKALIQMAEQVDDVPKKKGASKVRSWAKSSWLRLK